MVAQMLNVQNISKTFYPGTVNEKRAITNVSLALGEGEFVTVIGGNGAGKSTLLNCISGLYSVDCGAVAVDNVDLTKMPEHKRAKYLGRVFQDPMMGTAANMGIEENLAVAMRRGKRRTLKWGITNSERALYEVVLASLNLGLEKRLTLKTGLLSGGQRQALTLLMATLQKPRLLLLDEHTAALDPKTGATVLALTQRLISEHNLTTIMVTHNMKDALRMGNRVIMMNAGQIILDASEKDKEKLTVRDLLDYFEKAAGDESFNDRMLLL
jgi:putative ABC transport system ATP-binding protein